MKAFVFLAVLLAVVGEGAEKVGTVVASQGSLTAHNTTQMERNLTPQSDVYLGDTLITGDQAKGQVKFLDGTLILLIPNSSYTVSQYSAKRYLAELKEGGVRIATGLIAKKNPENFEISTPDATIGVRGTLFESNLFQGNLYVGASSGNLSVSNQGGSLDLGGTTQFTKVSSMQSAPQPLSSRPAPLNLSNFTPPAGGISFENGFSLAGASLPSGNFAWAPAVGSLVVFGIVVGVVAGVASQTSPTYSHPGGAPPVPQRNPQPPG